MIEPERVIKSVELFLPVVYFLNSPIPQFKDLLFLGVRGPGSRFSLKTPIGSGEIVRSQ